MSTGSYFTPAAAVAGITVLTLLWNHFRRITHPPFPPGPKPHLVLGNLPDFPRKEWHKTFAQWSTTYGDLIYISVLGTPFIIINSLEIARDLMVKKGNRYSGRIANGMVGELMQWNWSVINSQPGHSHTEGRAIFRKSFGQQEIAKHDDILQDGARRLVDDMSNFEGDPWLQLHSAVGAVVLKIAYGENIHREYGKQLNVLNEEAVAHVNWVATQLWLVNFFPLLQRLPDWIPLPFKREAAKGRLFTHKLRFWAWEKTVEQFKEGRASPSLALDYLEIGENLETARDVIAIMYAAGVETTSSTLMIFVMTMLIHPDVQKKAQAELDKVIEVDALVDFDDRKNFPYFHAAWRESARMNPGTPLGVPHVAAEDDVYRGMYIPKGAGIWPNIAFMLRDPRIWDDADSYKPERWLPEYNPNAASLPGVDDILFGFGRRVCPGSLLADRIGFMFAAALLRNFHILPLDGEDIPKEIKFEDSFTRHPEGIKCRFVPRVR